MFNKSDFNRALNYILRRHRHKMQNLVRYSKSHSLERGTVPVYDYGIKWSGGDIGIRIFLNENLARVSCHIGSVANYIDIHYYDNDNFVSNNLKSIKELIKDVEADYILSDPNYTC